MQSVTLLISIVGSVLVLVLPPAYALAAYVATLIWYPDYMRVNIGTIEISAGRIIVTVLLLRCLFDNKLRRMFVWSALDTWVSLTMAVIVGVYCITNESFYVALENRGGLLTDTWFAYLAARFIINDKEALIRFIKTTGIILAPLAIYGIVEATTGWQPFYQLTQFRRWRPIEVEHGDVIVTQARWGLTRAIGPFSHPIMFGECFVMFLPLIWALRHQRNDWGKLAYPLSGMAVLGAMSSMSSGPWGMLLVVLFCLVLERYKRWTKPLLIAVIGSCIVVGIISNRPFYHVLYNYMDFTGGSWYQRARLIDVAIEHIDEWWLAGYGSKGTGWATFPGDDITDANNEFILVGIEAGILGVIGLCAIFIMAFRLLSQASRQTEDLELKALYWSLSSTLVGVIAAWQGVNFFGQMNALFYSILGIIGSSFAFPKKDECSQHQLLGTGNTR
jgi:uncharacterized membrane protein YeaQ/YmgE (transglycosylase-associated protein family)